MAKPFTEEELYKVLANPFYCLRSVHPIFAQDHDTLVSEEQWVKASANLIREIRRGEISQAAPGEPEGELLSVTIAVPSRRVDNVG